MFRGTLEYCLTKEASAVCSALPPQSKEKSFELLRSIACLRKDSSPIIREILQRAPGASTERDSGGWDVLLWAIASGNFEAVRCLVESCSDAELIALLASHTASGLTFGQVIKFGEYGRKQEILQLLPPCHKGTSEALVPAFIVPTAENLEAVYELLSVVDATKFYTPEPTPIPGIAASLVLKYWSLVGDSSGVDFEQIQVQRFSKRLATASDEESEMFWCSCLLEVAGDATKRAVERLVDSAVAFIVKERIGVDAVLYLEGNDQAGLLAGSLQRLLAQFRRFFTAKQSEALERCLALHLANFFLDHLKSKEAEKEFRPEDAIRILVNISELENRCQWFGSSMRIVMIYCQYLQVQKCFLKTGSKDDLRSFCQRQQVSPKALFSVDRRRCYFSAPAGNTERDLAACSWLCFLFSDA